MGVRFLPDRRLRLEDGTTLDAGPRFLTSEEAAQALHGARVLLHRYPEVTEITPDARTTQRLVSLVQTRPRVGEYSAQLYTSGTTSVLVLGHIH